MPKITLVNSVNTVPNKRFISISKAAKILQLSPDTLRNWEKEGKLMPTRTSGGARRYSTAELMALKKEIQPFANKKKGLLSVKQAAIALSVSPDTIRNWDGKGLIEAQRTKGGSRRFTRSEIIRLQKELGIKEEQLQKVTKKPSNFQPEIHKFRLNYSYTLISVCFLAILVSSLFWMKFNPIIDESDLVDIKKQIGAIASSIEGLQRGVLGIQAEVLATPSAELDSVDESPSVIRIPYDINTELPLAVNQAGVIGCDSCLAKDSVFLKPIGSTNNSIKIDDDSQISLNTDNSNTWTALQAFNKGVDINDSYLNLHSSTTLNQNYSNNTTSAGDFSPVKFEAKLTGVFSSGETNIYGVKAQSNYLALPIGGVINNYGGYFEALGQQNLIGDSNAVGIFATASGANNNFAAIFDKGNVGIGTTMPIQAKLVISQQDALNSNSAIYIDTEQSLDTQPVLQIESDTTNGSGADSVKFKITADGSVFTDSAVFSAPADIAEMYHFEGNVEAGDVVELISSTQKKEIKFAVQKAKEGSGNAIFGIVSTNPGYILGYDSDSKNLSEQKPVAISGRVPVKVSNEGGEIKTGDLLTSSTKPGIAKKASESGFVIGKALEDFNGSEGSILAFINLSYAQISQNHYPVPDLPIQPVQATQSAEISTSLLSEAPQTGILDLTIPEILVASESATLSDLKVSASISSEGLLSAENVRISDGLKVFGNTILSNTMIAGDLTIDGTMQIGQNSINVIGSPDCSKDLEDNKNCGTLYIQNSPLAYAVDFFNGLVKIDQKGNLVAQSVTVAEFKVVKGRISGSGRIEVGKKETVIENPIVSENTRILITPTTETNLVLAVISKEQGKKFTVSAPVEVEKEINFDYFLIQEVGIDTYSNI